MDWIFTVLTALGVVVLLSPLLMLLVTAFVLVPLAHLLPRAHPGLARLSLTCPLEKRSARVDFLTVPGANRPLDVVSCSVFDRGPVRCEKQCLGLVDVHATPPLILARFALLDGGEALLAAGHGPAAEQGSDDQRVSPRRTA